MKSVGTVTFLPLSGWWGSRGVSLAGQTTRQGQLGTAVWSSVTRDYFRVLGMPLVRGRFFTDQDVLRVVVGQGLSLILTGVAIGLAGSPPAGRQRSMP